MGATRYTEVIVALNDDAHLRHNLRAGVSSMSLHSMLYPLQAFLLHVARVPTRSPASTMFRWTSEWPCCKVLRTPRRFTHRKPSVRYVTRYVCDGWLL